MRLIRVEAGAVRSYRELDLEFGGCQLIRICGKNGVGKSTINRVSRVDDLRAFARWK